MNCTIAAFARSSSASSYTCFEACTLPGAAGVRAIPNSRVCKLLCRYASSSTSITSESRTRAVSNSRTSSAATCGSTAKTAEYILTPAGIPRIGIVRPTTEKISRAVPSPPQKRMRSAPASRIRPAASIVSRLVLSVSGVYTASYFPMPARERTSPPMLPEQVIQ